MLLQLLLLPLAAGVGAQQAAADTRLLVSLADGRAVAATALRWQGNGPFELDQDGRRTALGPDDLLAVHHVPVRDAELPLVWLAGGEHLRGLIVGGDPGGDRLEIESPVLGRVSLAVDRLAALVPGGDLRPEQLPLPQGIDEALFRRAKIGFDLVAGTLHEFGARGVRFQANGEPEPRWHAVGDLAALRIADPSPRTAEAGAELWTRTGDRLGVVVRASDAEALTCELESGATVVVRWRDVACLCVRGAATFLSDLEPVQVTESGYDGEVVHGWQRDRAVLGGPLVAGGRSYGKGLGVHSRSKLTFVAPPGAAAFWTRVAIDDSAAVLALRADATVRVVRGNAVVFAQEGLAGGQVPADTGLVAVQPGDRIVLEVDFGKGRELGDRVAWLLPVFLPARAKKP